MNQESNPFRDGLAGVEAKRLKLLRDSRDELATMSHEIRKIYVRRFSRMLACIVLSIGGAILVAASLDSDLADALASLLPGKNPAGLSNTLLATWLMAGFALFSGRAWGEQRFAAAMSRAVLPTQEVHNDVSRLVCEAPTAIGQQIADRLIPVNRMVSVLAAGLIVPVTVMVGYLVVEAGGYPRIDDVDLLFATHSGKLLVIALMSLAFAMRLAFSANWRPSFHTAYGVATVVPCVFFLAPKEYFVTVLAGGTLLSLTALAGFLRRRKESSTIQAAGTPIAPVIRFRKRIAKAWTTLLAVPSLFRWSRIKAGGLQLKKWSVSALSFRPSLGQSMSTLVLMVGGLAMWAMWALNQTEPVQAKEISFPTYGESSDLQEVQGYTELLGTENETQFGATILFHFQDGQPLDATEHLQQAFVPHGWQAKVIVSLLDLDHKLHVEALDHVFEGPTSRQVSKSTPSAIFETSNCSGMAMPLLLHATPYGDWPEGETTASLNYEVELTMISGC